jgi:serine/threonine protein kinase
MQKLRSPFFDSLPPRNSPPCFESSEMKLNQVLGAGEYCRIHEVVQFEVPESCHICFLHRGYEEGSLSSGASKKAAAAVLAAGNAGGTTDANNGVINSKPKDETHLTSKSKKSTNTTSLTSPESGAGHKRGVSWDDVPKEITKLSSAQTLTLAERNTMDLPKKPNDRVISFFSFEPDDNISDYDDFEEDHQDEFDHETRGFMKDHCLRAGEARYAVKRIKHELKGEDIIDAAIDLAREAQFLAGLSHPSIIKIRGTVGVAGHPKFSIVLDRLYETLDAKMLIWGEEVKKFQGPFPLFGFKKDKKALKKNWISRLLFAYDIAHAMDYLHSRG